MFKKLRADIGCILERDPAARTTWEVLTCYPGLHAIYIHKLARWFWLHHLRWLGRFTSHLGRWLTGIEIHPGAKVGSCVFIDHGMGVVVGAGAKILGGFTVGDGARIGSNAVVVKEVPPGATVVGVPGRIVEDKAADHAERFAAYAVVQEHDDPYAKAIQQLVEHSQELERALAAMQEKLARLEKAEREQLRAVK